MIWKDRACSLENLNLTPLGDQSRFKGHKLWSLKRNGDLSAPVRAAANSSGLDSRDKRLLDFPAARTPAGYLRSDPESQTIVRGKLGKSQKVVSGKLLNMEEETSQPKRGILRNKSEDKHQ